MNEKNSSFNGRAGRNMYIDVIKGIAIFLVIWGHTIQTTSINTFNFYSHPVFKFIYTFHMPLFMLVSGYLFYYSLEKKSLKHIISTRIKSLCVPILVWGSIQYCILLLVDILMHKEFTISFVGYYESIKGVWFLWSVLGASIIVSFMYKNINKKFQILGLIFGIVFMVIVPNATMNIFMYPYFVIGVLYNKYKSLVNPKLENLKYICLIAFPIMICFFSNQDYVYISGILPSSSYGFIGQIKIDIFRWFIGLVGSIFIMIFIKFVYDFRGRIHLGNNLIKIASKAGKISLQIYVMQRLFLEYFGLKFFKLLMDMCGYNFLTKYMTLYSLVITPLIAICILICLYFMIMIINNNIKLSKVLFGR